MATKLKVHKNWKSKYAPGDVKMIIEHSKNKFQLLNVPYEGKVREALKSGLGSPELVALINDYYK